MAPFADAALLLQKQLAPPTTDANAARQRGRYVLENSVHVDVLVARSQTTKDGATRLSFDDCWAARQTLRYRGVEVHLPTIPDLITTKRWAMRVKDIPDIVLLEALRAELEKK
jgi:hypothetical protein